MNKKIIAVMIAATLIFVGVFAACNKTGNGDEEETKRAYIEGDEYNFVTDENGDKVLADDGEFIVYYTDENGKIVEDENGEKVTIKQVFEPVSENNQVEDFGYKITLPEGWSSNGTKGQFTNKDTGDFFKVDVIQNTTYEMNYQTAKYIYEQSLENDEFDCTFEENITTLGEDYEDLFRLMVKNNEGISIIHTFKNSGNLYCITYESTNPDTTVDSVVEIIKCITLKPFTYYETTTEQASTTAASTSAE